jgi:hypothetical protein
MQCVLDDGEYLFELPYDLSSIFYSLVRLKSHVFNDRLLMGAVFEDEGQPVLFRDFLKEWNPFVLFNGSDYLGLVKEDVQRRLNTKQLDLISGLELVAIDTKPISFAVLHQVV